MRLSPRKNEVQAVVDLLESDDYDSAQALAKAVVKATWEQLLERDFYACIFQFSEAGPVLAWGPFTSDKEVESFGKKYLASEGMAAGLRLHGPVGLLRQVEVTEAGGQVWCACCDHPDYTHQHTGYGGKCAAGGCNCTKIEKGE